MTARMTASLSGERSWCASVLKGTLRWMTSVFCLETAACLVPVPCVVKTCLPGRGRIRIDGQTDSYKFPWFNTLALKSSCLFNAGVSAAVSRCTRTPSRR